MANICLIFFQNLALFSEETSFDANTLHKLDRLSSVHMLCWVGAHTNTAICCFSPRLIPYLQLHIMFLQMFYDIQREKTFGQINGVMGIKECLWEEVETGSTVGEDEESSR